MRGIQEFITGSIHAMIDYIVVVSTVDLDQASHTSKPSVDSRERLRITNTLHQRIATAPTLHREATPLLPHLLDVPKHLAIVTSLIVRYSRSHSDRFAALDSMSTEDNHLRELCSRCLEVEDRALHRVSRLAVKPKHHSKSQKRTSDPMITTVSINENYESPIFTSRERKISTPGRPLRGKRSARPSTAPSPTSRSGVSIEPLMPPSPVSLRQITSTIMPTSKKPIKRMQRPKTKRHGRLDLLHLLFIRGLHLLIRLCMTMPRVLHRWQTIPLVIIQTTKGKSEEDYCVGYGVGNEYFLFVIFEYCCISGIIISRHYAYTHRSNVHHKIS